MTARARWLVLALALGACTGSTEPPRAPRPPRARAATEDRSAPRRADEPIAPLPPSILPAPERLVAFGDIHGDLGALERALRLGGAIDADGRWSGGALWVVQTGDLLDRGDDEEAILDRLEALAGEADAAGGRVIVLNGNHELMNAQGDFRYVTEGGFEDFAEYARPGSGRRALRGRTAAFAPGGPIARRLAANATAIRVGGTVFVHGGIRPRVARIGLDRINADMRAFLGGAGPLAASLSGEDSPVWHRAYALEPDAATCAELASALEILGAERMVVGHTVQPSGISAACDERVYRIDVGLAEHYGGPTEILEIRGDTVRVLR